MKKSSRLILLIVVGLIIVVGLLALLFRQALKQMLHDQLEAPAQMPLENIKPTAKEVADLEILKSLKLTRLKNNLVDFRFDDVCGRQAAQEAVSAGRTDLKVKCVVGNSRPLDEKAAP
jgi:hypothetical protein